MIEELLNVFDNVKTQGFRGKESEDTRFSLVKYKGLEFESQVGHGVYN